MVEIHEMEYEGFDCLQITNPQISIWITRQVGPRLIGLSLAGGENLMAVLPDAKIPVKGQEDFTLYGGHRLWYAPEKPETTYLPDDKPVIINRAQAGIQIIQPVDDQTGIQKSWSVAIDEQRAELTIDHQLTNTGTEDFKLAPWAVTMLRPGGTGVIPLQKELSDPHGLWPNRQLVFWPYTDLGSPHLKIGNSEVLIDANLSDGALKVGAPNPVGWIAYQLEGTLFVKFADYDPGAEYLDRRASSQIYSNPTVIELETLGPLTNLVPGESVTHRETWRLYPRGEWPDQVSEYFELQV